MSFKEKLIRARKAIIMGALAIAAVIPSVKGQTTNDGPVAKETISATEPQYGVWDPMRQQLFKNAVQSGESREEVAKYLVFPSCLPVDKNGQFDKEKAEKWAKALEPYVDTLLKNGESMSAAKAYKAFKEATGQKDISLRDFERVKGLVEKAHDEKVTSKLLLFLTVPLLLISGVPLLGQSIEIGSKLIEHKGSLKKWNEEAAREQIHSDDVTFPFEHAIIFAALAAATTFLGPKVVNQWRSTPARELPGVYEDMYQSYVKQSIKTQQQMIKQADWVQAQEFIQRGAQK